MPDFGYPNIDVAKKTNEQNLQSAKNYMMELSDNIAFYLNQMEARVSNLEKIKKVYYLLRLKL